nr:hypothetical protein [Bacteroides acidifaciens]
MAKTGLSYYQAETDRFQDIKVKRLKKRYGLNQKLTDGSEAYLSIWMVNPGSLTYGGTDFVNGMYGKLKEGSSNEYEFVDDGRKADFVTRGMILWSKAGEYKAYAESRFAYITLVKHE